MLAWILEHAGLEPGFLIGGVPSNFDSTARLGGGGDARRVAFRDRGGRVRHGVLRQARQVRALPAAHAILNNLEYDHADIYPDVASIRRQFDQLLRTVPGSGRIVQNGDDAELEAVIAAGCWTPRQTFSLRRADEWSAALAPGSSCGEFTVLRDGRAVAEVRWPLLGEHNVMNALAAIAAADHVGVPPERAALALGNSAA